MTSAYKHINSTVKNDLNNRISLQSDPDLKSHVIHLTGSNVTSTFLKINTSHIVSMPNHEGLNPGPSIGLDNIRSNGIDEVLPGRVTVETLPDFSWIGFRNQ